MALFKPYDLLVTVILPVHNSPWLVEKAVLSAIQTKNQTPFKLAIYDDGSDGFTKDLINQIADHSERIEVYLRDENVGFIKTVNHALTNCKTRYALILNSDVVLGDYWLDKLVEAAETDKRIATVNPLTNRASQIEIAIPPGVNFLEVNRYLQTQSPIALDVVTGVGFCMLLRMEALQEVGFLDEIYGAGYCEESDLCMRLTTNGWRTVVAPNTYVYHKGAGSFTKKRERYLRNRRIFDERWRAEYRSQFYQFQQDNPLGHVRRTIIPPHRWAPVAHARQTYRFARDAIREKQLNQAIKELIKGGLTLPKAKTPIVCDEHIQKFKSPSRISVTYIMPFITMAGGVISVIQIVNELILRGIDARIATLHVYPEMAEWAQYFGPMIFRNYRDMQNRFPDTDIVVATHWTTASSAIALHRDGHAGHSVYFVQDYEPWFFPKEDRTNPEKVKETYRRLQCKIVKSNWLAGMLKPFGGEIHKIRLGMDLGIYYPREGCASDSDNTLVILAMARPRTPRRGFATLVKSLASLKSQFPKIKIRLFGDDLKHQSIPFPYEDLGIVVARNTLCQVYSEADIFIDASDFQGFGRAALEAMACGTACVVTDAGGVNEYARDGVNALMVPPKAPDKLTDAVVRLVDDNHLRHRLVKNGYETVKEYCHKREALETAELFQKIATTH